MTEEITTRSWLTRIKDAFAGVLIGVILIISAFILIFWSERQSLHKAQSLEQAKHLVISIPSAPILPQNNLKVVYLSGFATTNEQLKDPILGLNLVAIHLNRLVEMYQWQENVETKTESQVGGTEKQITTYTYRKVWSDKLINSNAFNNADVHQNPALMPLNSKQVYAQKVVLGDFILPERLIKQINVSEPVDLSQVDTNRLVAKFKKPVHLINHTLYVGNDPQIPTIGDFKISVDAAYPQNISIIGQQIDSTLKPYVAQAGGSIFLLVPGQHSADEMIAQALSDNKILTWILRLVTLLMLIGGFLFILNPLVVLAEVHPLLGGLVGFGTGVLSILSGLTVWGIATALAWFSARPFIFAGSILVIILVISRLTKRKTKNMSVTDKS